MNIWCFTGNLGNDCEMRYTQSGTPICGFSVATTAGYGERKTTTWVRCSIIGTRGEAIAPYLLKGQQVAVSGEAKLREWQDRDGATRSTLEVTVNDVTLVGGKPNTSAKPAGQPGVVPGPVSNGAPPTEQAGGPDFDDDIPF